MIVIFANYKKVTLVLILLLVGVTSLASSSYIQEGLESWSDILDSLVSQYDFMRATTKYVEENPWDLIYNDLLTESGFGVLLMYDMTFYCEEKLASASYWFLDAILSYSAYNQFQQLGWIINQSPKINSWVKSSFAYQNTIERVNLKQFVEGYNRTEFISEYKNEIEYSRKLDTSLNWLQKGKLSFEDPRISIGSLMIMRSANALWKSLDSAGKKGLDDLYVILVVDGVGDTILLIDYDRLIGNVNTDTIWIDNNTIVMEIENDGKVSGIITDSGIVALEGFAISNWITF